MPTPRPFRLGDQMALVAAMAIGLALDRWRATEFGNLPTGSHGTAIAAGSWIDVLSFGRPSCFVAALAAVLIPLRWMRPRPSGLRVLCQPGSVACLAIVGTLVVNILLLMLGGAIGAWLRRPDSPNMYYYSNWYKWWKSVHLIPVGVGGAWSALALGGRWSPERSWIDRMGIILGIYWLAAYFFGFFSTFINLWLPYNG